MNLSILAGSSDDLHADLTRAVVRSSDWLKKVYMDKTTEFFPHRAASMISIIRLAGHMPETILSEFKNNKGENIEETLNNYLDLKKEKEGNLNKIPAAELALIIQAVLSICQDSENFHGHNLINPLHHGFTLFKKVPSFNNYFRYSLAVIALCNSGRSVPDAVVRELIHGAYRNVSYHMTDIDSLILQALACISNSSIQREVDQASQTLATQLISKQNKETGAVGNQISTSHVLMVWY